MIVAATLLVLGETFHVIYLFLYLTRFFFPDLLEGSIVAMEMEFLPDQWQRHLLVKYLLKVFSFLFFLYFH